MYLVETEQNGDLWWTSRAGRITASSFHLASERLKSGPNKGWFRKEAEDYAFLRAVERISGRPIRPPEFEPWEARRGRELEPDARYLHALEYGLQIEPGGVAISDCGRFAASADGLIGEDGGSEYKAYLDPAKVRPILLADEIPTEVIAQMQGGMMVTGRDWWHFALYVPDLEPIGKDLKVIEVERDQEYIDRLAENLEELDTLIEDYREKLEADQ